MRGAAAALALLFAGCGQTPASNEGNSAAAPATNVPEGNAAPSPLPPAGAALGFVGRWATSAANCPTKAWRFTRDTLTAADGPHCSIYKVTKAPGGYDLAARCPTKKPDELDLIRLRFAESARAMLVESNAIAPMGLIYCGK
jgi:hypothetical protein